MIRPPRTHSLPLPATLLILALLLPHGALAEDYSASRKFGRGLANIAVGFLEIPGNVVQASHEGGPLAGITVGLALGLGKFVTRELVGAYEVLSAPFAVPSGFVPILEPEFAWQYFDDGAGSRGLAAELEGLPGVRVSQSDGGVVVTMPDDVLFRIGSSQLSSAARVRLAELAAVLRNRPGLDITVRGHTDNTGSPGGNLTLSTERARAVAQELTNRGVDSGRMGVQGLGDADPVAGNDSPAGRRLNRRVEIELR